MREISDLISYIKINKPIGDDKILEILEKINKQFKSRMIKSGISNKFYCHNKVVLAGNKRCDEVCHYCLVKGNLKENKTP
jgi:hypothetical protein